MKNSKSIKTITKIFNILVLLSMLVLIYSITLISKIETTIMIVGIIAIILFNALTILIINMLNKNTKTIKFILFVTISSILFIAQLISGYIIIKTYSTVSNMTTSKTTYTSVLITLKDNKIDKDLKDKNIGITKDETSIDGYILGLDLIKKNNLKKENNIIEYDDNNILIEDLYNEKIDCIIISGNYISMFQNIDKYKDIEKETKILMKETKNLSKKEISKYTNEKEETLNEKDAITEPFTLLVMGIDSTSKELDKSESSNGDALMLVTFNPKTLNTTILSIPRDSYVPIACFANQKENKITHAGWNGSDCMIKTIENFTGINIDYYIKINFKGVVNLVDALGGIEVDVPIEFCEQNSNRSFSTQDIQCLKEGLQTLNGEQALALSRHRKTLLTGDLQRGKNQQLVASGIINKIKTVKSASQALKILDSISMSIDTNFTTEQLLSFYEIAKNIIATSTSDKLINMQQLYLYGANQGIYDESMGMVLSDYIPNQSSLKQIIDAMKKNLKSNSNDNIKKLDFNIEDLYEQEVIGTENLMATKTYTLLPNFKGSSLSYAKSWLSAYNIKINVNYTTTNDYNEDTIISQNMPEAKRVDLTNEITFTVAQNNIPTSTIDETTEEETENIASEEPEENNTEEQTPEENNTEQEE